MTKFTPSGRKRCAASVVILLLTGVNTALSTRVNYFQDFFFVADKFPLIMSVVTMVVYSFIIVLDFVSENAFIARPPFYLGVEAILSIFWLAFNAFSTSRWRHIPLQCDEIPKEFEDERSWCRDLQALKSFVWIEWLLIFLSFAFTLRFAVAQHSRGRTHVWRTALSRFSTASPSAKHTSEFLQYAPRDGGGGGRAGFYHGAEPIRNAYEAGMRQTYRASDQRGAVPAAAVRNYDAAAATLGLEREPYYEPQPWAAFARDVPGERESTAGGPGLAGVGAGPGTPARWGGFERM